MAQKLLSGAPKPPLPWARSDRPFLIELSATLRAGETWKDPEKIGTVPVVFPKGTIFVFFLKWKKITQIYFPLQKLRVHANPS